MVVEKENKANVLDPIKTPGKLWKEFKEDEKKEKEKRNTSKALSYGALSSLSLLVAFVFFVTQIQWLYSRWHSKTVVIPVIVFLLISIISSLALRSRLNEDIERNKLPILSLVWKFCALAGIFFLLLFVALSYGGVY